MTRRIRREDPAYLAAMREAKALFDAEMAKSAMKSRGRPAAAAASSPAPELVADEPDALDDVIEIDAAAAGDAVTGDGAAADAEGDTAPAPKAAGGRGRRAGDAKKR